MDIARPDRKKKIARQRLVAGAVGLLVVCGAAWGISRLKPAAPSVDRSTVWTDTVKHGELVRQVRGIGTLTPKEDMIRLIPAQTEATVVKINVLPGAVVKPETVLLQMADPQLDQELLTAQLDLKSAQVDYSNLQAKLQSDLMTQRSGAATVTADHNQAEKQAESDKALYKLGVISGLTYSASQGKADQLSLQDKIEADRLTVNQKAIVTQLEVQQTKVQQAQAMLDLKQRQESALHVTAGIAGTLTSMPLQIGQHVTPGTTLAEVVQPDQLKAALKIPETQARDIQIGQPAEIDTHNGVVTGNVTRVDPAVVNGTVTVDVAMVGALPQGARPDLSVDGTIDLDRLKNVLYVGRPAVGNENSTISLFRVTADGKYADRVNVKVGKASVNAIQILNGLSEGDTVILSDMSRWDNVDRVRLD